MICGLQWGNGATLCTHGCPKNERAAYDVDGYNQCGYHRDTGLSRSGFARMPDALPSEESAVEDLDWEYEPFDEADLADLGWANGTGLGDGGQAFLDSGNAFNSSNSSNAQNTQTNAPQSIALGNLYLPNGWGMDVEGYDASGYSMCQPSHPMISKRATLTLFCADLDGIDRQGRDRNGLDEKEKIDALDRDVWF